MQFGKNNLMGVKKSTLFKHFGSSEVEHILVQLKNIINQQRKRMDGQLNDIITDQYINLQQICLRLIEIKGNKAILQYIDRLIQNKNAIAEADGAVNQIEAQVLQLQTLAWYITHKRLANGGDFLSFCLQYFKGIDIVQDTNLQNRISPDLRSLKLKPNQIRYTQVKDWLNIVLQQFPKQTLSQLIQSNEIFVGNNFSNQQIKQYFHTQFSPSLHSTRSNMFVSPQPTNSPYNSRTFQNDHQNQRSSISQVKQQKNQMHMKKTRETEQQISVQQKYSLLIIKNALEAYKCQTNQTIFSIRVVPFQQIK